MDPVTIGVTGASVLAGIGATSFAGLKAWNGWLELKRMDLTHGCAERNQFCIFGVSWLRSFRIPTRTM